MPYIKQEARNQLADPVLWEPSNAGELNYSITKLIWDYARSQQRGDDEQKPGLSYRRINDVLGALEGAKLEFYRRVAVPYENAKMAENGDVYE